MIKAQVKERVPSDFIETASQYTSLFFVHIPKTAGGYILKLALKNRMRKRVFRLGHPVCMSQPLVFDDPIRAWNLSCIGDEHYQRSLSFTVVRNPFDMLVSMYTYGFPYALAESNPFNDFASLVRAYCDSEFPWIAPPQHRNLFFQLFKDDGTCGVHYAIRTESLDEGLKTLCSPFGIIPIASDARINASPSRKEKDHRKYYNDELRGLVEVKCQKELEDFGYTFDGPDERLIIDLIGIHYNPL